MMGLSVYYRISFLLLWTFLAVHLPAQTWSAQQAYFGWFGDNPRTTPNATVISAGSFATASVMSGGTGVVFTSTQDGVATVFKADNINSTSMATAITNGDYIKATLSIPAGNPKIRFTYASLVGTIGTWSGAYTYGMTVTDLATGVSTTVFQNVSVPTTQTNVPQTLATPYEMIPGKNYEVRWYMYDASFSSSGNVTRALDNPVLYFEVLTCYTTATPPALSVTTKSNVCPTTTVDLTTITANNTPANTVLEWHSGTPVTAANKVATPSAVVGGTYYAVFYDAVNNCYSNTTSVTATSNVMTTPPVLSATTQSNVCPATTIDLTGISSNNTPIGTVLEWHSGLPLSTANKIVTPNAVGVGTYYATFYDAGNDCYSPYTLVKAVSNSCMPISVSNICPATTIDLTSINSGNTPPDGTVLEWHSGLPLSIANKIATPNTVLAGTYYATFYDAVSDCYSPPALVTAIANPCTPVTITNICPTSTIDLTSFSVGNMPTGTVLEWHSDIPLSIANKIATPKAVLAGTYYATFYDAVSDCYSPPALVTAIANPCPPVTITNICPTSTIDLTSFSVGNMPTGTVLEWHSGLPLSVANKILAPNAVSAGTYYATFYDAVSDCYSPPTLVTGTSNPCQTVTINNVCTSQSVFYSQTFGAGTGIGAALPAAQIPSYTYNSNNFTVDGQYTIIQNPRNGLLFGSNSPWLNGADHTGDVNGRMLLINGSSPGQIAYNQPVTGLVIGRTYAVRTFIANVIDATTGSFPLLPNINFYIKDASNNTLATTSTGDIPISPKLTWLQKEMSFVATTTSVTFQLVSNNTSGNGNDFALDDITFYEKVEPLLSSTSTTVSCPAKTANLSNVTVSNLPSGARLSWHSGTPATAANELTNVTALPAGTYYAAFTDEACYSIPTPFTVNPTTCPPVPSLCTSQSVFYSQTFGSGTGIGAALPAAQIPSYTYNSNNFTVDGQYTIIQNPRNGLLFGSNSPWLNGADHTGDVNGRMLLVNGSSPGQIAYNQPVTGLVIGRTYAVRTFIANVIDATTGSYPLLPNINFYIKDASNNTLATTSTGDIPISPTLTWLQKEMSFVATTTSVTFQLVSNNTSGNGNDFALDDITFYEKVEPLLSSTSTTVSCPAKTANLSTVTVGNLPFGARLSWHSGTPATAANELTNIIALPAGTYYAAFTDGVCYSNPIPFTVNVVICPCPTVSIGSSASTTCSGGNVTLTATTTGLDPTCQLQWQNSLDGVTWSNIVGANTSIYIVTALMTTMKYRAIIFCPNNNCCN